MDSRPVSLFAELKRRNVFRAATAYVVTAWLIVQVVDTVFPAFGLGSGMVRLVVVALAIGFVPAVLLAWVFELTPRGFVPHHEVNLDSADTRRQNRNMDRLIIVVLGLAVGYFAFDKFVLSQRQLQQEVEQARLEARIDALAPAAAEPAIVVLPFADLSPGSGQGYLSDGIAGEIRNLLAKVPGIRVLSRTSAVSLGETGVDIAGIAAELGVTHFIEGSVTRIDDRLRVSVQLADAASDSQLWSGSWNRAVEDIFLVQEEIASAVVRSLEVEALGALPKVVRTTPEAYTLFLQAQHFNRLRGTEALHRAHAAYQAVLDIDPTYVPAWLGLAHVLTNQVRTGEVPIELGAQQALDAIERALAIDSNSAPAWANLAYWKRTFEWDWDGAQSAIDRAMSLAPNDADVLGTAASLANSLGRNDLSIRLFERAASLDPLNLTILRALGRRYLSARDFERAADKFRRVLELNPEHATAQLDLGLTLALQGEPERGLVEIDRSPPGAINNYYRAIALSLAGREREATQLVEALETSTETITAHALACVEAWLGRHDAAIRWLELAYENRSPNLVFVLGTLCFENLEGDDRYLDLLERLGLRSYWLERQNHAVTEKRENRENRDT